MQRPSPGQGRPPAMSDVAQAAGVSHQTVSRVVNGSEQVAPATRDRVEAAIRDLGYRRNLSARALVTQRSGLVGIVASGFPHMGPASTVGAIELAARAAGYATMVAVLADPFSEQVGEVYDSFLSHGVQGIIVVAPQEELADQARAATRGTPTVLVADLGRPDDQFHLVAVDQPLGARLATRFLIDRGLRSILHISGPRGWFDAETRILGWQASLVEAGLAVPHLLEGDWSAATGYRIGRELVAAGPLPDAVFCANDLTALGLLAALREAGLRAPDALSVVGYDDIDGARYLDPPLTTVRQPFADVGTRCMQVLLAAIDGAPPSRHAIAPTLIERASTR